MNKIEICNMALSMLGIPSITSFNDDSDQAKQCKNIFPVLRDRVLRDHTWSFAGAGYDLQRLDENSFDPDFAYVCSLPGDFIRMIRLANGESYRMNGRKILLHSLPARILYIRRIDDAGEFDPTFCEALQYLLAAEICMSNTRDGNLSQFMRQEYERRLAIARSIDSQENIHAAQPRAGKSSFLAARHYGNDGETTNIKFIKGNAGVQ